jgi:hypothetical protein
MALKPESITGWVTTITGAVGALVATAVGTYISLQSAGLIGGKLETINAYLNEKNVGEQRVENILSADPKDVRIEYVYEGGDTLYFRQWKDAEGQKYKLKRWTSKTPVDILYDRATARRPKTEDEQGTAVAQAMPVFEGEIYIGVTEDGLYVYLLKEIPPICEFQDATGAIVDTRPPPCEQYVVEVDTQAG